MRGVGAKVTRFRPPGRGSSADSGMFETASWPSGTTAEILNTAFFEGSSNSGRKRRASAGSNWVVRKRPPA
jgi:hypothetical protein